jgi:predicted nucleic acid-binding protein
VLVDTSVWIDHFRRAEPVLASMLEEGTVECHPFVIGELACGHLRARDEILGLLEALPALAPADHGDALAFLARHRLAGSGAGWLDVHLLAATALGRTTLWTRDRRLREVARRVGLAADVR